MKLTTQASLKSAFGSHPTSFCHRASSPNTSAVAARLAASYSSAAGRLTVTADAPTETMAVGDTAPADTTPVEGAGWPPPRAFPVRKCLLIVLNEEWQHRLYAERDLDVLFAR
jgi:hypothetical protein